MVNDNQEIYVCCHCGKHYNSLKNFNVSHSTIYGHLGHLPICKECLGQLYETWKIQFGDEMKAMQKVCMAFDIYFDKDIFEKCCRGDKTDLGNYIKSLNRNQYKDFSFDNTLQKGFYFNMDSVISDKSDNIDPALIQKWGEGLELSDYNILEKHLSQLKRANPNLDSNQEIFVIDLCYLKMLQQKAIREGRSDDFVKLSDSYNKKFNQANLKVTSDVSDDQKFILGVTAETIEQYAPAEYYKNKQLFKDFDGVGDYFIRHVFRPLKNLQHGSREKDKEYYVKEGEDYDE